MSLDRLILFFNSISAFFHVLHKGLSLADRFGRNGLHPGSDDWIHSLAQILLELHDVGLLSLRVF